MQGQANHFFRYAPEKIPYAINWSVATDTLASYRFSRHTPTMMLFTVHSNYPAFDNWLRNNNFLALVQPTFLIW